VRVHQIASRWSVEIGKRSAFRRRQGYAGQVGAQRFPFPALAAMSAFSDFAPSFETPAASSDRSAFPGERPICGPAFADPRTDENSRLRQILRDFSG
jgi:hypothetical protein